jgi:UDP-N-acetylmuramoylalanine--D-glutamate ligase
MLHSELLNIKRVAVFGMALSGISAVKALVRLGLEVYAVNEGEVSAWKERETLLTILPERNWREQSKASHLFSEMDLIILSPGIPKTHSVLAAATNKNVLIISEIELGFWLSKSTPVVAITGTNGKTTTTTMIAELLKLSGKKVFCGGNIGLPYTELFLSGENYDWAVIEVSSFQLETIRDFHPGIAFILNVTANHMERYSSLEDYAKAKWQITKNMSREDILIIGKPTSYIEEWSQGGLYQKTVFDQSSLPLDFLQTFSFEQSKIKGQHNHANFYAAYQVLEFLQIPGRKEVMSRFINSFNGVEHRLEFVRNYEGLKIYNDAKSTNVDATKTALKAFNTTKEPCYLILGGKLRSESDRFLADLLPFKNLVTKIFTIGATSSRLKEELSSDFKVEEVQTLSNLMDLLKKQKLTGNLIFSPAHPSFDQFENYVDRGQTFKRLVNEL